jgi:HD domain-containing protein
LAERPPDTAFVRAALDTARAASSDMLLHHCLRTWLWADLVAQIDRIPHDPELLYVACVLHDLGLTPSHWCRTDACFAVEGARAAYELATVHGYPHADALADVICLHLNAVVPVRRGAEAHLLHAGAAMDVVGARVGQIPAHTRAQVLQRHTRDGFLDQMLALGAQQRHNRPRSRIALLQRFGFANMMHAGDHHFR